MGIPKYHSWLKKTYPSCFSIVDKQNVHHFEQIYIDMSYVVHSAYYSVQNEIELQNKIFSYIKYFIKNYKPTKKLFLCFDGCAGNIKKTTCAKRKKVNERKFKDKELSPKIFSNKSEFMKKLNLFVKSFTTSDLNLSENVEIIVSEHIDYGEAEIKIAKLIKENNENGDKILIISNDSDMVLISLCTNIKNIQILNFNTTNNPSRISEYITIDIIKNEFSKRYNTNYLDLVLLSLFNGNDYFPKLKFTSYETIWKAYELYLNIGFVENISCKTPTTLNKSIVQQNVIVMNHFNKYIYYLYTILPKQFKREDILTHVEGKKNRDYYIQGLCICLDLYTTGIYKDKIYSYKGGLIHPAIFIY